MLATRINTSFLKSISSLELNHFYWFSGATIGGLLGGLISFNTEGLDFVMTAMFVVIFLEQWQKEDKERSFRRVFFSGGLLNE